MTDTGNKHLAEPGPLQTPSEAELAYKLARYRARIDLLKVVFGTTLVGLAAAGFPFAQKWAEVSFQTKIEEIRKATEIAIQTDKSGLERETIRLQIDLERETQRANADISDRDFLNSLGVEGRSADIDTRIRLAEYFSFVTDDAERLRWAEFRDYLIGVRIVQLERREELRRIQLDPITSDVDRTLAAEGLLDIDRVLTPATMADFASPGTEVPYEALSIDLTTVNGALQVPTHDELLALLGPPNSTLLRDCGDPDNELLKSQIASADVGPFNVSLLAPALNSLRLIFEKFSSEHPESYSKFGTGGGLCVRLVRGANRWSKHSYGVAVDFTVAGILDRPSNKATIPELALLAPFMIEAGWYWGAAFSYDEPHHFEVSSALLQEWVADGQLRTMDASK